MESWTKRRDILALPAHKKWTVIDLTPPPFRINSQIDMNVRETVAYRVILCALGINATACAIIHGPKTWANVTALTRDEEFRTVVEKRL